MRSDNFVFSVLKISCIKWYFISIEYYIVKYVLCPPNKKLLTIFINLKLQIILYRSALIIWNFIDSKKNNS